MTSQNPTTSGPTQDGPPVDEVSVARPKTPIQDEGKLLTLF